MTTWLSLCAAGLVFAATAEQRPAGPPKWFQDHMTFMTQKGGRWTTDNSAYRSETEPFDAYGTEWTWGVGKKSIVGRLFGLRDGEEVRTFWEYRVFWHPGEKQAYIHQFGGNGAVSLGTLEPAGPQRIRMKQKLVDPRGVASWIGHDTTDVGDAEQTTQTFDIEGDTRTKRRFYRWKLVR